MVIFETIKEYDEPVKLSEVFLRYKYFELDLNMVNKSAKSANCGFFPISTTSNCPPPEDIDFRTHLRNIYIMLHDTVDVIMNPGDIRILIKDLNEPKIESIDLFAEGRFEVYRPLYELYLEKNPENKRYSLSELLNYAKEDGAINKEKYLSTVLQDLRDTGYFKVTSPVALYDNILVGRRVTPSGSGKTTSTKSDALNYNEDEVDDSLSLYHKYANLLDFNPNIILYGPPGTGKTYAATKIVEAYEYFNMGKYTSFKDLERQGRLKFITFHQAYSYEEFIEGIRPRLGDDSGTDDNEGLGYNIEDGILKQIAISASRQRLQAEAKVEGMESLSESSKIWKLSLGRRSNDDIYNDCKKSKYVAIGWLENHDLTGMTYEELYKLYKADDSIKEDPRHVADCLDKFINGMNKGDIVLIYNSPTTIRDIGVITDDYEYLKDKEYPHTRKVRWIKEFKQPANIFDYNGQVRLTLKTIYELYRINFSDIINLIMKDENDDQLSAKRADIPPYYLIIDEINRGNIAKIFGELITLIEKDKREKISCYLPYSKKPFTLPNNLYIIGTMNTADRSIAILDTALRRRFAFIEIEPDLSVFDNPSVVLSSKVNDCVDLAKLLEALNKKITEKIDRDHRIGHAYFMNIPNLNELYYVWYYKIIPLLMDYFYNDVETLQSIIGKQFFNKDGSINFLDIKKMSGGMTEFEQEITKIYLSGH